MKKLLIQIDSSPHPSVFDRVVAFDGGADEVMSYGGVAEADVRDLVHGAIFTRGPKDLHHTAIFIGGTDMAAGERLLAAVKKTFFGPMRVSVMLDSNGSNTTAVAAVARDGQRGRRLAAASAPWSRPAPGPSGCARRGCWPRPAPQVTLTSRRRRDAGVSRGARRSGSAARCARAVLNDAAQAAAALEGAEVLISAGPGRRLPDSQGRLGGPRQACAPWPI